MIRKFRMKAVSILAVLCLVLPLFGVHTFALTDGDWEYTDDGGVATLTGYTGAATVITIPSTLGGLPVTKIGTSAFISKDTITSVTIPNGITEIGYNGFYNCSSLTSLSLPGSLTTIGNYAFNGVGLVSVELPQGLIEIGGNAFSACPSLSEVIIPSSVTTIGGSAFRNCTSLSEVTIPSSATSLGPDIFASCSPALVINVTEGSDAADFDFGAGTKNVVSLPPSNDPPPTNPDTTTTGTVPSEPVNESSSDSSSSSSSSEPEKPEVGDVVEVEDVVIALPETAVKPEAEGETAAAVYVAPKVVIADTTPVVVDDKAYAGTVKVESVNSDKPQEIPKEVVIGGESYIVGDTVYIVGTEEKKVEATAETGFSYVFTAVENSDNPVKFKAEGLPDALEMTEDGVITTKTLPIPAGEYTIKVTADNGADTSEYTMTIVVSESGLTDEELLTALTANNDPDLTPEVLSLPGDETTPEEGKETGEITAEENGESETSGGIPTIWMNGDVKLHYTPEIDDFYGLFLDGKLLIKDEDYLAEEGSTVIILTEKTVVPLKNGDHVVTTLFEQNTEIGMDTVINDVGSSSFVFRMGDKDSDGKRINIGGDGVSGSVTFEGGGKEEPITTISANTEAIEKRVNNLSNASGKEIIAAFETKQQGGFGGKTAIFAISAKSLNLSLKNGTAVYVAVYDAKTGKTYQNKGEIKDGMIIFRTKHSGVFMIGKEKF